MKVFIGVPSYNAWVVENMFQNLNAASEKIEYDILFGHFSSLTKNFNNLFVQALNARKDGVTHFAMIHADIGTEPGWLDKMTAVMEREQADVVSAIVPIKDSRGLTSTAFDEKVGETDQRWRVRRLTLKEAYKMPPSFSQPDLLLNTGLMLVDIRKPWEEKIHFRFEDDIIQVGGKFIAVTMSEDWLFSRDAKALGAKLVATREVAVVHFGQSLFDNKSAWGTAHTDKPTQ